MHLHTVYKNTVRIIQYKWIDSIKDTFFKNLIYKIQFQNAFLYVQYVNMIQQISTVPVAFTLISKKKKHVRVCF